MPMIQRPHPVNTQMPDNFRVIIVGGGPIGLAAAHTLRLAGIDYIVLEQRPSVFEELGAAIGLSAFSLRVMHQFGVLESLQSVGTEIEFWQRFDESGYRFSKTTEPQLARDK